VTTTELWGVLSPVLHALVEPLSSPASRTYAPSLLVAALVALAVERRRAGRGWTLRRALGAHLWGEVSARLDVQLLAVRQLLRFIGLLEIGSALGLALAIVRGLDHALGRPATPSLPVPLVIAIYSSLLFIVGDLSRFLLHRAAHRVPWLWSFHKVHHSATVLTPLSFHRIHPVESLLFQLRGVLVTGTLAGLAYWLWRGHATVLSVLGVEAVGFAFNLAVGNLRHSHVWLPFPAALERWFLSPAQHQRHHGATWAEHESNYGTWLAVWDRLGGSLRPSGDRPPERLGLGPRESNHVQELWSALVDPFRESARRLRGGRRGRALAAAGLLASWSARADDAPPPADSGDDLDTPGESIIVEGSRAPTPTGAAHEIGAETLERDEQDDIHRVLAKVPGVYVRGEEGHGLRPNIGMRGANSDRSAKVTLLEDGVPLSPAPYAAPAAYYFPLTTRLAGVEVFKGPSSIAQGPQTIGGAVNFLTRDVPRAAAAAIDVASGSHATTKLHGWAGTGDERGGLLLEGAHLSSAGFKHIDGGGPAGFERQDLMAKGELDLGASLLSAKLGYGRELSYETYLGLTLDDFADDPYRRYAASAGDVMQWQHTQASLGWEVRPADTLLVRTVAYHNWLDRDWTKLNGFAGGPDMHALLLDPDAGQAATYVAILRGEEDSASADQALQVGTNAREFHNFGLQSVARWWTGSGKRSNLLEVGVRLHDDEATRLHTEDPQGMVSGTLVDNGNPTVTTLDSVSRARALATWARDDLALGPVHLVPGLRLEHVVTASGDSDSGPIDPQARTILLPGLGVLVNTTPWLAVLGGVHRGFSPVAPGSSEDTLPETAWNAEAGLRAYSGPFSAELVGFGSLYDNVYGQCSLSAGCADEAVDTQYNGGEAWVAGVESGLGHGVELPRSLFLSARLTYTYTYAAFQSEFYSDFPQWGYVQVGDELPYVPGHQGAAEVELEGRRARITIGGTHRGQMRDVAGQGKVPTTERLPAATVFDISTDVDITRSASAYLLVRNVLDTVTLESLRPYGARPGAPLTVMLGLKYPSPRTQTLE